MAPTLDKDAKDLVACSTADSEGFTAGIPLVRGHGNGPLGPTKDAADHPVPAVVEIEADRGQHSCHKASFPPFCGPRARARRAEHIKTGAGAPTPPPPP